MTGWDGQVRPAAAGDAGAVGALAAGLATSFPFSATAFAASYPALLADPGACVLVAAREGEVLGYLLGFRHLTFYAGGPAGWVEEVAVAGRDRGQGAGRALMSAFEDWAAGQGCPLVALATRRAAPFYRAIGYEESAAYFRKLLALAGRRGHGCPAQATCSSPLRRRTSRHQPSLAAYQSTVCSRPCAKPTDGRQPSSRSSFAGSMR